MEKGNKELRDGVPLHSSPARKAMVRLAEIPMVADKNEIRPNIGLLDAGWRNRRPTERIDANSKGAKYPRTLSSATRKEPTGSIKYESRVAPWRA